MAALQAVLLLLSTIPAKRLPVADFLDSVMAALKGWAYQCGCFTDSPLFPKWSERLLGSLYLLLDMSQQQGRSHLIGLTICQVCSPQVREGLTREQSYSEVDRETCQNRANLGTC